MGVQQFLTLDPIMEVGLGVPEKVVKLHHGKGGSVSPCNRRKKIEVAFEVQGKTILADKIILSKRSPVFDLMFFYGWNANGSSIPIYDANCSDFTSFIEYLQRDKLHLSMDNAFGLLKLAATYAVGDLQEVCDKFLASKVDIYSALTIADNSLPYGGLALEKSMDLINERTAEVVSLPEFCKISEALLEMILSQSNLNLKEEQIFNAFYKWTQCHPNHYMEDIKQLLRFPVMDPLFLKNVVGKTSVLSPSELEAAIEDSMALKNCNSRAREFTFSKKNRLSDLFYRFMICKIEHKQDEDAYTLKSVSPIKVVNGIPRWKYTKVFEWKSSFSHEKRLPYVSNA